ncbi:MAG: PIG-L family deacetylase [Methylocystaceae bacterium]|nr:PIG-L family deacetylase [Methylocystaceae bacterium]
MIARKKSIAVISAHADDETLGCGGTILKHSANGDVINWLIATSPQTPKYTDSSVRERKDTIKAVAKSYGMNATYELGNQPASLHESCLPDLIGKISKILNEIQPEIIYVVYPGDVHSDHKITFDAVWACTKSFRLPCVKQILCFETLSSTNVSPPLLTNCFIPNSYCDITDLIDKKIEILSLYKSEIMDDPHPRSFKKVRAISEYRGADISVKNAEAFMILKAIF